MWLEIGICVWLLVDALQCKCAAVIVVCVDSLHCKPACVLMQGRFFIVLQWVLPGDVLLLHDRN